MAYERIVCVQFQVQMRAQMSGGVIFVDAGLLSSFYSNRSLESYNTHNNNNETRQKEEKNLQIQTVFKNEKKNYHT